MSVFLVANWIGTISFALSGFLVGARRDLDILGVLIVSFLTALGGGILRDVMLGKIPIVLTSNYLCASVMVVVVVASIFKLNHKNDIDSKALFVISDAIGLISFAISGAIVAVEANISLLGSAIIAFVTAIGGGILRDTLINEVPFVLISEFYGTVALIAGIGTYLIYQQGIASALSFTLLFSVCLTIRIVAWRKNWHLPKLSSK